MYEILYADTVDKKQVRSFPKKILTRIEKEITIKLRTSPEIFGKPLKSSLKGYRRLRIGQYRVLYKIHKKSVIIVFIGKKPSVYKKFKEKNI